MLVKWRGYEKPEWEREHVLRRDDCQDAIRVFWAKTGLNPTRDFYPDATGKHRCTIYNKTYSRLQDLKVHRTRSGYKIETTPKRTKTTVRDAVFEKRKEMQKLLPTVKWGNLEAKNAGLSKYLGSIMEAGGRHMHDVKTRIVSARQRFGKM